MRTIEYRLTLTSDGEPGSGLGGEVLDDLLPRSPQFEIIVRGTHLKGLIRENLEQMCRLLGWGERGEAAIDRLLGFGGNPEGDIVSAFFEDAVLEGDDAAADPRLSIFRTAIGASGTAKERTLRGSEAVATGSAFMGRIDIRADDALARNLLILGLRSVTSIGRGRRRGAGACWIAVTGDSRMPSDLLREVAALVKDRPASATPSGRAASSIAHATTPSGTVWCRLRFAARASVCCPDVPLRTGVNVIHSGPMIPASAVMGAILTAISREDEAYASALITNEETRFWPLFPVPSQDAQHAFWSSMTLRRSKDASVSGGPTYADPILGVPEAGVRWKGCEGVTYQKADGRLGLWRAVDIPREITAHAVPSQRNLYVVDSIASREWVGMIALPPRAVEILSRQLAEDPLVAFGRNRTVRGLGELTVEAASGVPFPDAAVALIAQSPVEMPDDLPGNKDAGTAFRELARRQWPDLQAKDARALTGCRFGWSRFAPARAGRAVEETPRLRAQRVFLPGAVIVFEHIAAERLHSMLLTGLGGGRDRGFGALAPYAGLPEFEPSSDQAAELKTSLQRMGIEKGLELIEACKRIHPPSKSQVSSLQDHVSRGETVRTFLEDKRRHGSHGWEPWIPFQTLLGTLDGLPTQQERAKAVEVWRDSILAKSGPREGRP